MPNELTDQESRFAWEPTDFVWEKAPVEFSSEQKAALGERPDSVLASDNRNARLPTDEVAIAGADGREVARLLRKAKEDGAKRFNEIVEPAVERLLSGRVWFASNLFSEDERTAFIESITEAIRPADLLGRSRVWLRYKRDEENTIPVEQFSDATPFVAMFADPIEPLKPEKAIDYFKSLAPKLGVDPERYAGELRRRAFTMAEATEKTILTQVKKIINDSLTEGTMRGDIKIQDVLTKAGVSPENPQYSEMVYRTNMMDAFNTAQDEEMARPEIQDAFPAWRYDGIEDERTGEDHAPYIGQYFRSSQSFASIRGDRIFNCRCSPRLLHKFEWEKLLADGATFFEE